MNEKKESFWKTLPSLLTGIIIVITAIATLYAALHGATAVESKMTDSTTSLTSMPTTTVNVKTFGGWQQIHDFPSEVNVLLVDPTNSKVVYAATGGGVYKSEDTGMTWHLASEGLPGKDVQALAMTHEVPTTIYAAIRGDIYTSTDSAESWARLDNSGLYSGFNHRLFVAPSDGDVLFHMAIPGGVARSSDGGLNWQYVHKGLPGEDHKAHALSLVIDPTDKNVVYLGTGEWVGWGSGYGVYKSTDGGNKWFPTNKGMMTYRIIAMALDPSNPQIIYASEGGGKLFKSIDGGQNWNDITDKLPAQKDSDPSIQEILIDPAMPETIFLLREKLGVLVSNDGGASWRIIGKPPMESDYHSFSMAVIPDKQPVLVLAVEDEDGWRYERTSPTPPTPTPPTPTPPTPTPPTVSLETIITIIAAIATIISSILTITIVHIRKIRTKKTTAKILCSEVKENQKELQSLSNLAEYWENDRPEPVKEQILQKISFNRAVYSNLLDKIGLLDLDGVVEYYIEIKLIEEEYNKLLRNFFGKSISKLKLQRIGENYNHRLGRGNISSIWDEIDKCFTNVKEAYSTGNELIGDLESIFNNVSKTPLSRPARKFD
jgi:photosystem II stability/assembly factor-like uncharacterized protein